MPLGESLSIWRRCIQTALVHGPLTASLVAGHFSALLRASDSFQQQRRDSAADEFLAEFAGKIDQWQHRWREQDPAANTPEVAATALGHLRFFDRLSLWLCCAESNTSYELCPPVGPPIHLHPQTPYRVTMNPWPLNVPHAEVSVRGTAISQRAYHSDEDLSQAILSGHERTLVWQLKPAKRPA